MCLHMWLLLPVLIESYIVSMSKGLGFLAQSVQFCNQASCHQKKRRDPWITAGFSEPGNLAVVLIRLKLQHKRSYNRIASWCFNHLCRKIDVKPEQWKQRKQNDEEVDIHRKHKHLLFNFVQTFPVEEMWWWWKYRGQRWEKTKQEYFSFKVCPV